MDVRISKLSGDDDSFRDLSSAEVPAANQSLLWAFAGTSSTTEEAHTTKPPHTVWKHWVDSKTAHPGIDEGDMFATVNGLEYERGENVDPHTGNIQEYEELWKSLKCEGELQGASQVEGSCDGVTSVVLQTESSESRGLIVRVGQWIQGMLKVGNDVTVERWLRKPPFDVTNSEDHGRWESVSSIGQGQLPTVSAMYLTKDEVNLPIECGGLQWVVKEFL